METYFLPVCVLKFGRLSVALNEFSTWIGTNMAAPTYEAAWWNHRLGVDDAAGIDNPKTTNSLESWHRTLNAIGQKSNHKFWTIFVCLREELGENLMGIRNNASQTV